MEKRVGTSTVFRVDVGFRILNRGKENGNCCIVQGSCKA